MINIDGISVKISLCKKSFKICCNYPQMIVMMATCYEVIINSINDVILSTLGVAMIILVWKKVWKKVSIQSVNFERIDCRCLNDMKVLT